MWVSSYRYPTNSHDAGVLTSLNIYIYAIHRTCNYVISIVVSDYEGYDIEACRKRNLRGRPQDGAPDRGVSQGVG